jgi:hypothetical protein
MSRTNRVQYFDTEGRQNLPAVIRSIKTYLRSFIAAGETPPSKIVFFTAQGEGPMLAYNQLSKLDVQIIAVTFPANYCERLPDNTLFSPQIPDKVRKFFIGVEIPIITSRLPFDEMAGAEFHNKEMATIRAVLGLYGGGTTLAIQAVLQATDAGEVNVGERVIAVTGDTALLVTASTTRSFLRKDDLGLSINEIICKPRSYSFSRKPRPKIEAPKPSHQIEGVIEPTPKP